MVLIIIITIIIIIYILFFFLEQAEHMKDIRFSGTGQMLRKMHFWEFAARRFSDIKKLKYVEWEYL